MKTTVAVLNIIVEKPEAVEPLNCLLHDHSTSIIGRIGIPYRQKGINIICVTMDAPMNEINTLCGALGRIDGISSKAAYSKSK